MRSADSESQRNEFNVHETGNPAADASRWWTITMHWRTAERRRVGV